MKRSIPVLTVLVLSLALNSLLAQDKAPVQFGKISPEDFDLSKNHFDTSASAVVIADIGISSFEGNQKGSFTLAYKRQRRVKILDKSGFRAANVDVVLYSKGDREEKLDNLKAVTYNLEDGKVIATKLDNASVFSI